MTVMDQVTSRHTAHCMMGYWWTSRYNRSPYLSQRDPSARNGLAQARYPATPTLVTTSVTVTGDGIAHGTLLRMSCSLCSVQLVNGTTSYASRLNIGSGPARGRRMCIWIMRIVQQLPLVLK